MRTTRAAALSRTQILTQLKDDHKRVRKAYRDFQKLDRESDPEACAALVQQVLAELRVHAAVEEELLYPAAHSLIKEEDLLNEAEVEHEMMHVLIDQLASLTPEDEHYAARFTVLCEYVLHHVKEEEGQMFPQLEKARTDWESLERRINERREELSATGNAEEADTGPGSLDEDAAIERPPAAGQEPRPSQAPR